MLCLVCQIDDQLSIAKLTLMLVRLILHEQIVTTKRTIVYISEHYLLKFRSKFLWLRPPKNNQVQSLQTFTLMIYLFARSLEKGRWMLIAKLPGLASEIQCNYSRFLVVRSQQVKRQRVKQITGPIAIKIHRFKLMLSPIFQLHTKLELIVRREWVAPKVQRCGCSCKHKIDKWNLRLSIAINILIP